MKRLSTLMILATALVALASCARFEQGAFLPPSDVKPLTLSGQEPWSLREKDEDIRQELVGDTLVYVVGNTESASQRIVAADAATGKTRWTVGRSISKKDSALQYYAWWGQHTQIGDDARMIVQYTKDIRLEDGSAGKEQGVAALSVHDGTFLWSKPLVAGDPRTFFTRIDAAAADLVIATIYTFTAEHTLASFRTVALDATSASPRWQMSDVVGSQIVGNVVLAERPILPDGSMNRIGTAGVEALDMASGEVLWSTDGRYSNLREIAAVADGVLISHAGGTDILQLRTGEEFLHRSETAINCIDDTESIIACESDADLNSPGSFTIDLHEPTPAFTTFPQHPSTAGILSARSMPDKAWKGRLFFPAGKGEGNLVVQTDRFGVLLDKPLRNQHLISVNDDYAVTSSYDQVKEKETIFVYSIAD